MELWDIYDLARNPKGRTHPRGLPLKEGDFHLVVQIWICNSRGMYLIQKRTEDKDTAPGLWATTAGSAVAGEDSRLTCLRETEEELGWTPDMSKARIILSYPRVDSHVDVWMIRQEVDLSDLVLQKEEVDDARWATVGEIREMAADNTFWPYAYLDRLDLWAADSGGQCDG